MPPGITYAPQSNLGPTGNADLNDEKDSDIIQCGDFLIDIELVSK